MKGVQTDIFNPIPPGVLENQDTLGWGGQFVLCPNMTNDTSLESSCALLLESAKKLQKLNFYRKIQLCSKNACKKNCPKNKKYTFLKMPLTMSFKIKIFAKF